MRGGAAVCGGVSRTAEKHWRRQYCGAGGGAGEGPRHVGTFHWFEVVRGGGVKQQKWSPRRNC